MLGSGLLWGLLTLRHELSRVILILHGLKVGRKMDASHLAHHHLLCIRIHIHVCVALGLRLSLSLLLLLLLLHHHHSLLLHPLLHDVGIVLHDLRHMLLLLLLELLLQQVWSQVRHGVGVWRSHAWTTLGQIHHLSLTDLRPSHRMHLLRHDPRLSSGHALIRRVTGCHGVSAWRHSTVAGHGAWVREWLCHTSHRDWKSSSSMECRPLFAKQVSWCLCWRRLGIQVRRSDVRNHS